MRIEDAFSGLSQRSTLPAGGTPADDNAFTRWLGTLCDTENTARLDRHYRDLKTIRAVSPFLVSRHLHAKLVGWQFRDDDDAAGPTYQHRLRFLAIQYRLRPLEIQDLVAAFFESYP